MRCVNSHFTRKLSDPFFGALEFRVMSHRRFIDRNMDITHHKLLPILLISKPAAHSKLFEDLKRDGALFQFCLQFLSDLEYAVRTRRALEGKKYCIACKSQPKYALAGSEHSAGEIEQMVVFKVPAGHQAGPKSTQLAAEVLGIAQGYLNFCLYAQMDSAANCMKILN